MNFQLSLNILNLVGLGVLAVLVSGVLYFLRAVLQMEVSWLRVLLDNISSYLTLSSMDDLSSNPALKYYTRGEEISNLLKPVLENLIDSDAAPSELLNNGFEELAQYCDELREQFESWQPLSTRIFYVSTKANRF